MNVKGSFDTVYVVFSGDKTETSRETSFAIRKNVLAEFPLEAGALARVVLWFPANRIKQKMSAQTDNRSVRRTAL